MFLAKHIFADDLTAGIARAKALLLEKANPNSRRSQQEITEELDAIVQKATSEYSQNKYFLIFAQL